MVSGASTRDIEQMPFGVVDVFKFGIIGDSLDSFLGRIISWTVSRISTSWAAPVLWNRVPRRELRCFGPWTHGAVDFFLFGLPRGP